MELTQAEEILAQHTRFVAWDSPKSTNSDEHMECKTPTLWYNVLCQPRRHDIDAKQRLENEFVHVSRRSCFFAETDDDHADEPTWESMIKPRPGTCWLNSKSKIAWQLVGEPRWLRLGKQNILQLFLDFCWVATGNWVEFCSCLGASKHRTLWLVTWCHLDTCQGAVYQQAPSLHLFVRAQI